VSAFDRRVLRTLLNIERMSVCVVGFDEGIDVGLSFS